MAVKLRNNSGDVHIIDRSRPIAEQVKALALPIVRASLESNEIADAFLYRARWR